MDVEALLRKLDDDAPCAPTATGYWAAWPDLDVRAMARLMRENVVRLVTITAVPEAGDALRIIYHWDADGELLNLSTTVMSGHVPTISDIVPGADWVEREIHDYYGLEFDGRSTTPPLMLREGDPPGLFARTRQQGNEADPARTAHAAIAVEEGEPR
ncbi:NADH-quinone oxidoreductase subunit C [Streptomyces cavernae]|uniref:NADH-quinone oxidoreductase subunit C n=1 Tax=Streptomyces cavernae TaxID=2259034 RepID=UPI000FEB6F87|nr:NADH-quinone oxidoreductase subunit C [Streptomyces cavernae]